MPASSAPAHRPVSAGCLSLRFGPRRFRFLRLMAAVAVPLALGACAGMQGEGGGGRSDLPLPDLPLTGTVWAPDPAAPGAEAARFRFHDDGRMSARGPCNRMFGRYQTGVDDLPGSLRFGGIGATRMACDRQKTDAEMDLIDGLLAARQAEVEGNRLTIVTSDGRKMGFRAVDDATAPDPGKDMQ